MTKSEIHERYGLIFSGPVLNLDNKFDDSVRMTATGHIIDAETQRALTDEELKERSLYLPPINDGESLVPASSPTSLITSDRGLEIRKLWPE